MGGNRGSLPKAERWARSGAHLSARSQRSHADHPPWRHHDADRSGLHRRVLSSLHPRFCLSQPYNQGLLRHVGPHTPDHRRDLCHRRTTAGDGHHRDPHHPCTGSGSTYRKYRAGADPRRHHLCTRAQHFAHDADKPPVLTLHLHDEQAFYDGLWDSERSTIHTAAENCVAASRGLSRIIEASDRARTDGRRQG